MYSTDGLMVEMVMVTPQMARHLRDTCHYERQRDLSDDHVKFMVEECRLGRFLRGTQVHFCVLDGRPNIVNGNHTLEMIAAGKESVPLVFLYERVASEDEMGRIYARHDSHRPRDWTARLRATGQADALDLNGRWLNSACSAAMFLANDLCAPTQGTERYNARRSADMRVDTLTEWGDEIRQYSRLCHRIAPGVSRIMRRAILIACGAYVIRYQPSTAADFIAGMAADDGLSQKDPRKRLLEWCRANKAQTAATGAHERRFRSAWNAFFENRTLSNLYEAGDDVPLRGTPFGASKKGPPPVAVAKPASKPGKSSIKTGVKPMADGSSIPFAHLLDL